MNHKVVLGLSDGVDSAVAARVLQDEGYEVYGLYLDISGENAKRDAISSAKRLGIPLRIQNIQKELEKYVCRPFLEAYLRGETPNPCIGCNPEVKFPALIDYADEIQAHWIATGHYARCENGAIYTGAPDNDQSYMLTRLTKAQIARLLLPLGRFHKHKVREMAREMGLSVADKPDSREICFIPSKDYASWLEENAEAPGKGEAIYCGRAVAMHEGIHKHTVGQRFGETEEGRRLYVSAIDAEKNQLLLALWDDLFHTQFYVRDMYWQAEDDPDEIKAIVRVRHTRWEMPSCTVKKEGGRWQVTAQTPLRAPAKGQTAAFYDGEKLLGGGFIDGVFTEASRQESPDNPDSCA